MLQEFRRAPTDLQTPQNQSPANLKKSRAQRGPTDILKNQCLTSRVIENAAQIMKAQDFDTKFENDEDLLNDIDLKNTTRSMQKQKRVSIDLPAWMLESLDREANRVGVT